MNSPPASPPVVRLRPAPYYDPPYDDERHPELWNAPWQPPLELDPPPPPRRTRRSQPPPVTAAAAQPPIRTTAARFINTCLEVLNGLRPASHLRPLCRPLEARGVVIAMTHATRRLQRTVRRSATGRQALVRLRRLRLCQPCPDVLEAAAVIGTDERSWAAAFRLEQRNGRWQCTAAAVV